MFFAVIEKCSNAIFKATLNYLHHVHDFLHWVFKEIRLESPSSSRRSIKKPFFAFERMQYKRLWPLYIADMKELRSTHPKPGNISVTKSEIPFVSIGDNQACEQVNKMMKIPSGWIGISNNANVYLKNSRSNVVLLLTNHKNIMR